MPSPYGYDDDDAVDAAAASSGGRRQHKSSRRRSSSRNHHNKTTSSSSRHHKSSSSSRKHGSSRRSNSVPREERSRDAYSTSSSRRSSSVPRAQQQQQPRAQPQQYNDDDQLHFYDERGQKERRENSVPRPEPDDNIFTRSIPAPPLASFEDENPDVLFQDDARRVYDVNVGFDDSLGSAGTAEERRTATEIHQLMQVGKWKEVYESLSALKEDISNRAIIPIFRSLDEGATIVHTASWKAPPSVFKFMLDLVDKEGLAQLVMTRDGDGNIPLHLYCGNLEVKDKLSVTILKLLVTADPRTLAEQNSQGDIPLHLLVESPACTKSTSEVGMSRAQQAVNILVQHDPSTAIIQDTVDGATPLHAAIGAGAIESVLLALLDERGSVASKVVDERGFLPLHYVAAFLNNTTGRSISAVVVEKLIEAFPEAISAKSTNDDTPLHIYISNISEESKEDERVNRNTQRVLELLMGLGHNLDELTSPIMMVNNEKLTPLHCCAVFDAPPAVTRLLMKHPMSGTASAMPNLFGATAMHLACAQPNVSNDISNVLALGTRQAAKVEDRLKRTPLHVAAQNQHATAELIEALVDLNPEATSVRTQRGHLPLHLAAQSEAKESVIRALIRAYPKASEARNKSSNTPLHDAAKYRASLGVVKILLESNPDAVYIQNQYGNLPLHCATAYQAQKEVVLLLLDAWPDGAAMQNRNQDAPLHYAAAYTTTLEAVKPLIDAAPAAVLLLNQSGQSPIDRAKMNNAPDEIIELLEESAEEWTRKAATDGWGAFSADFGDGF